MRENHPVTKLLKEEIPSFLTDLLTVPPLERLKDVGMNCGVEYMSFPFFKKLKPYSRYYHSLNVALIIYHFTHDEKQTIAGLFHDIATPCFAHVVDFMNKDYLKQESTEKDTEEIIRSSEQIQNILTKLALKTKDVSNYHLYPIADNDSPRLSSDRLEYTLSNIYNYGFATLAQVGSFYDDLLVAKNEFGNDELCFRNLDTALSFSLFSLKCSRVYISDEDRGSMQALALILRKAIDLKVISYQDLYLKEKELISKLRENDLTKKDFTDYLNLKTVKRSRSYLPLEKYCFNIKAKKRYIDPYVFKKGRLSSISLDYKKEVSSFLNEDTDYYVCLS